MGQDQDGDRETLDTGHATTTERRQCPEATAWPRATKTQRPEGEPGASKSSQSEAGGDKTAATTRGG